MEEKNNEAVIDENIQSEETTVEEKEPQILSDDELYAKIETEKLLKRNKKRKIATFVSLCVAMALAICVIILSAVPISLRPKCLERGFKDVGLYAGSSSPVVYANGDDGYDKFMKKYGEAFSQTYLSALFNGSLGSYHVEEKYTTVKKCDEEQDRTFSTIKSLAGTNNFVRFRFSTEKVFTNQNGSKFVSKYTNSRLWDGTLKFNEAYLIVNSTGGLQTSTIYVVVNYPVFVKGEQTGTDKCLITVTVKGDTNLIYDAWNDLV